MTHPAAALIAEPGRFSATRPRRIALVQGALGYGGSERQLSLFLAQCDRSAWEPHVYAASSLGRVAEQLRATGVPVTLLIGSPVRKLRDLRRAVREQQADVLLSWSSWTNVFAWAVVGLGLPRVGSFRNAGYADLPVRGRALWAWASRSNLSVLLCNSRETAATVSRHTRTDQRILFVPNAVEPPAAPALARRTWRRELGIGDDQVLVMGIGRLTAQKGFDRFIDAVVRCGARSPIRAVLFGPDHEGLGAQLLAQIDAAGLPEGTVRYLGPTRVPRELVCAADIFLLSSLHEGMPNVLLEAMAAGVPCVTTPVSGVSSVLTHEVDGLVADHDAASMADALLRLVEDPDLRRRLGEAARRRLADGFSADRVYGPVWEALADEVDRFGEVTTARRQSRMRTADVALCVLCLPVAIPLMLAISAVVRLSSPGPILHLSVRTGRDGHPFVLHKFRTMRVGSDVTGPGVTTAEDPRVTRVGRWLRRSKLDELPQLFDVLSGEMSLVGPRPEDPRYVDLRVPAQRTTLRVRPGLTSPASLQFRDEQSLLLGADWEQTYREQILPRKLAIDGAYVENATLPQYTRVLARTAWALLPRPPAAQRLLSPTTARSEDNVP